MARLHLFVFCAVLFALAAPSLAGDPDLLQDVCVADLQSTVKLNGFPCKADITADDFFFAGLKNAGNTNNAAGSNVTAANVVNDIWRRVATDLEQWKILSKDAVSDILARCALLLNKKRGEVLRIAWQ